MLLYLYHYQILFIITNQIWFSGSGFIKAEMGRSADGHRSSLTAGERTPTRPKASDRITLGSHGNSAFQPITASCKIVPQAQPPSPAESPGKSFQPITMSCKIVSGNCLQSLSRLFCWFARKPQSFFVIFVVFSLSWILCALFPGAGAYSPLMLSFEMQILLGMCCNPPEGVNSVRHIFVVLWIIYDII